MATIYKVLTGLLALSFISGSTDSVRIVLIHPGPARSETSSVSTPTEKRSDRLSSVDLYADEESQKDVSEEVVSELIQRPVSYKTGLIAGGICCFAFIAAGVVVFVLFS